jgi:hypothetical protein
MSLKSEARALTAAAEFNLISTIFPTIVYFFNELMFLMDILG